MLELTITLKDGFDEETNTFVAFESVVVQLEYSLVTLSKWESKWEKAFLDSNVEKTTEMTLDFIRCMLLNPEDEKYLDYLNSENIAEIQDYMQQPQSAAWFAEARSKSNASGKIVTSDLIYYYMVALTIPFQPCETWNINRLMTLIKITDIENQPKKNMPRKDAVASHRSLNNARRAKRRK